jgi:hypothetical protein
MEKLVTLYARLRLSRSSTKRRPPCPESTAESTSNGQRSASESRAPGKPTTRCACALSSFFTAVRASNEVSCGGASACAAFFAKRPSFSRTSLLTSPGSTSPTTASVTAPGWYFCAR